MSLKDYEEKVTNEETVGDFDFGFEAEYTEFEGYTTISGKEQRLLANATQYNISDFEIGKMIMGYPEVTIFNNNDKNDKGEFKRNYQSVRLRIIDGDEEYVDLYANIPRRTDDGFISGLNKFFNFYRTGFDLVFSFMRWVNESNVYTSNGETINKINRVNIENICHKIDSMSHVKVKIIDSGDEAYPSWILLDMQE